MRYKIDAQIEKIGRDLCNLRPTSTKKMIMLFKGCISAYLLTITCTMNIYFAINLPNYSSNYSCNRNGEIFHPCGTLENYNAYNFSQPDRHIMIYFMDTNYAISRSIHWSFRFLTMIKIRPWSNETQVVINCSNDFSISCSDVDRFVIVSTHFQHCGETNPVILLHISNTTVQLVRLANTGFFKTSHKPLEILSSIQDLQIINTIFNEVADYAVYINSHHTTRATFKNISFASNPIGSLWFHSTSVDFDSSLTLLNCLFTNNTSENTYSERAVRLYSLDRITIINCTFIKNSPQGAILIENIHLKIFQHPIIQIWNSTFINNTAPSGGAVVLKGYFNLTINSSCFILNSATYSGGSITISGKAVRYIQNNILIIKSYFRHNSAVSGGALNITSQNIYSCVTRVSSTIFSNNYAVKKGGALSMNGFKSYFQDCMFSENDGNTEGGSISILGFGGDTIITNCTFNKNSASLGVGGAIAIDLDRNNLIVNECYFTYNTARFGGAMKVISFNIAIHKSNFTKNQVSVSGGALYIDATSIEISGSCWLNNSAITGA